MQENTDQKNPKYGLFSRSVHEYKKHKKTEFYVVHIFLLSVCKWEYRDQRNLVFYVFWIVFSVIQHEKDWDIFHLLIFCCIILSFIAEASLYP